jgi:hypothetical protein
VFAVAVLASGIAAADTIVATGVDNALAETIYIDENGTDNSETAGVIDIQLTGSSGTVDRYTMCVDLFTNINEGTTYNTTIYFPSQITSPASEAAILERIAWLEDNALLPTLYPGDPSTLPSTDWASTPAMGAGLQLAIWDIEVDGGDGFSAGQVQAWTGKTNPTNATVLQWATTYETLSSGQSSNVAFVYENVARTYPYAAAQTLEGPSYNDGGPHPTTPESSTFVLAGVALLALGRMARRKLVSH